MDFAVPCDGYSEPIFYAREMFRTFVDELLSGKAFVSAREYSLPHSCSVELLNCARQQTEKMRSITSRVYVMFAIVASELMMMNVQVAAANFMETAPNC